MLADRIDRMCGRYALRTKLNVLLSQFAAELADRAEWKPRYNVPPTANVPAVRLIEGNRQRALFKWGLIPSWAKDAKIAYNDQRPQRPCGDEARLPRGVQEAPLSGVGGWLL
jgi:putative SOS response-associated peptidase YedK